MPLNVVKDSLIVILPKEANTSIATKSLLYTLAADHADVGLGFIHHTSHE